MAGGLSVRLCLGINPSACRSVLGVPEDRLLVYLCGTLVVLLHTETKEQTFLQGGRLGVSAIAVAGRRLLAAADRGDPSPAVSLYDLASLKKRKVLLCPELACDLVSVSLSEDGRLCAALGGGPDFPLVVWSIDKAAKVLGLVRVSVGEDAAVSAVTFCPGDASVLIALGKNVFRLFRILEGQVRPATLMVRREQSTFISHRWVGPETLVVGTEAGEILLVDGLEFRAVLFAAPDQASPIHCFGLLSSGAFVAGSSGGSIHYFARIPGSKEMFQHTGCYKVRDLSADVLSLAVNGDDSFVCATSEQQLLNASVNHLNAKKDASAEAEYALTPFHGPGLGDSSAVTGLDVALWRPTLVSCGRDRTVRVWSLVDRRLEIMKRFEEEPNSVSVHPSGIFVAVGFDDRVRLLAVLLQDLFVCRELFLRNCSTVKFSRGGQYFAALSGLNIAVFCTYDYTQLCTLKGHIAEICAFSWTSLDSKLVSIASDGAVFTWDVAQGVKCKEEYSSAAVLAGGVASTDGSRVFCAHLDRKLRVITTEKSPYFQQGHSESVSRRYDVTDIEMPRRAKRMVLDEARKLIYLGVSEQGKAGGIIVASIASSASGGMGTFFDNSEFSGGAVTSLCLSADGASVIVGDELGCIFITQNDSVQRKVLRDKEDSISPFELVDEVLMHQQDLEASRETIRQLEGSLQDLVFSNEFTMQSKEAEHSEHIRELSEKYTEQLRAESLKYDMLEEEKVELEENYARRLATQRQTGIAEMQALEIKYKGKIAAEDARFEELQADIDSAERSWDSENEQLLTSQARRTEQLVEEYERKIAEEQEVRRVIVEETEAIKVDHEIRRRNVDDDADVEVGETRIKYEQRLVQESKASEQLHELCEISKKELDVSTVLGEDFLNSVTDDAQIP